MDLEGEVSTHKGGRVSGASKRDQVGPVGGEERGQTKIGSTWLGSGTSEGRETTMDRQRGEVSRQHVIALFDFASGNMHAITLRTHPRLGQIAVTLTGMYTPVR